MSGQMSVRWRWLAVGLSILVCSVGGAPGASHAALPLSAEPLYVVEEDTLKIRAPVQGNGTVELQTRLQNETTWTRQKVKLLPATPRWLAWELPLFRVPDTRDSFFFRFVAREGGRQRVLFRGREFKGPVFPAPIPELSPSLDGFTLTYSLLDPRPVFVTLEIWDPVVGWNLFSGGRWIEVYTRYLGARGEILRVTEPIATPFDAFDVGRQSRYRLFVSYDRQPVEWRLSAPFAVAGTSWLTYTVVTALLLLGGGALTALWPLIRSRARLQEELRLTEVRSHERQRGMTLLANKIGHEAEAWMASIRWLNALLRREVGGGSRGEEYVAELERAADQLSGYLLRLKEYGRPPSISRAPLRVSGALRTARLRADHTLQEAGVEVCERLLADDWLLGDESEIVAALGNLIQNAAEAMVRSPERLLTLTSRRGERDQIVIEIRDTGPGIAEEIAQELFAPFRSTRGEGRGLGLAIARKNVEAHGGTVICRREPSGGTSFVITLPRHGTAVQIAGGSFANGNEEAPREAANKTLPGTVLPEGRGLPDGRIE